MNDYNKVKEFINNNAILKNGMILLGLGGSRAYGTAVDNEEYHSDYDYRGICLNTKEGILGINNDFDQFTCDEPDLVIYSLRKMVSLLSNCNPNTIEILGLKPEHYLYLNDIGKKLVDNRNLFLSKKAAYTFGAYAQSQLSRLFNRSGRANEEIVQNEARSMEKVLIHLRDRHRNIDKDSFSVTTENDVIYLSMHYNHMSIEEIMDVQSELSNVHSQYKKSTRNNKAIEHNKLSKHGMHLVRLYMMGIDILKNHEIITYRDGADHDLLMRIRSGEFLESDMKTPTKDFENLVTEYAAKFKEAQEHSTLPEKPNYKQINKLLMEVNEKVVKGDI